MEGFLRKAGDRLKEGFQDAVGHGEEEHEQQHHDAGTSEHHQGGGGHQAGGGPSTNNRFGSFAPQTSGNVKWFVDGATYFYAVSVALEEAQESIYILDWWLSPELYLRRPPAKNEKYRLDNMLTAAAERGVEVRIIVYKEVKQALSCDSAHTKHALEALHENIKVFRHPDHVPNAEEITSSFDTLSLESYKAGDLAKASGSALKNLFGQAGDSVLYWAHHEKLIVVDRKVGFMGGLDLCFGRWDTMSHPIADAHPGNLDAIIFPGQDYNNARIFDFEGVNNWDHNQLDRTVSSRMGWSDVTISLKGPIVGSMIDHFTDRWNFIFGEKYTKKDEGKYQRVATRGGGGGGGPGRHGRGGGHGGMHDQLHRGVRKFMGGNDDDEGDDERERGGGRRHGGQNAGAVDIQLCRSCCEWSAGHPTEHSIANAYIRAITEAEHFVYIENQFFITATGDEQKPVTNKIGACIVDRIVRAHDEGKDFRLMVVMPAVPAFPGDLQDDAALGTRAIMEFQYNSISRGGHSIIECLQRRGVDNWQRYIGFYNLRNYDRINVSSTMNRAERESGVDYEEGRRGYDRHYDDQEPSEDSRYHRYQSAARHTDDRTSDTISSCYMANGPDVRRTTWEGPESEELAAFVCEELYVHSKCLIADDRRVIIGSANLNDRSQLGTHDSEIAVVIEGDPTEIETTMNGEPYTAARFATTLRRMLYRKHLGLVGDQSAWSPQRPGPNFLPISHDPTNNYDFGSENDRLVEDPLSPEFRRLWRETARTNTEVFDNCFHPVPSNRTRNWREYKQFFSRHFVIPGSEEEKKLKKRHGGKLPPRGHEDLGGKVPYGHVVPGQFDDDVGALKEELSKVRGTLVDLPLDFLVELGEDMAMEGVGLNFATKEIYT